MQSLLSDRKKIDDQLRVVHAALGMSANGHLSSNSHRASRRRRMSSAARRALSKRMKAYWATKRKEKTTVKPKKS